MEQVIMYFKGNAVKSKVKSQLIILSDQKQNRRDLQQSVGVSLSAGATEFVPGASDASSSTVTAATVQATYLYL